MKKEPRPNKSSIVKVRRPHPGDVLARERLYSMLDAVRTKPLLWISGPAGSGKTTLATAWITDRSLPCLWYQIDERDADLSSFFYYLGRAAHDLAPRRKTSLPLLTSEYRAGLTIFSRGFFEQLFSRLQPPCVLVFDNYQNVPADSPLHDVITKGLEAMPPDMTMVMLSRDEPPAAYARLRAGKGITFVGWNELRFTPEEIAALNRRIARQSCAEQVCPAVDMLYERTDGWAAGLILVLESLRRTSAFRGEVGVSDESHCVKVLPELQCQSVFDYFAGELFDKINRTLRDFLLKTAFLPSMTRGMAIRQTRMDSAARILSRLSRGHYFTDWRPGPEPVYQYHPLFREFLLSRACECFSAEEIAAVRKRAAALLEEAGRTEEAIELYRDGGDTDAVIRLILAHESALLAQGRNATLESWLACIPESRLEQDPALLRIAGLCRLPFNLSAARSLLEKALSLLEERSDYAAALAVHGCLMEVIIMEGESFTMLDRHLERAHELAQHDTATAAVAAGMAGTVLFALAFRSPDHPTLSFWRTRAEEAVTRPHSAAGLLKLYNHLMAYYLFVGECNRMSWLMETLRPYKKEAERVPMLRLLCILLNAYHCAYARGEAGAAIELAREGLALARQSGIVIYNFWLFYLIAVHSIRSGEV